MLARIAAVASVGVDWIQLREKDLSALDYARLTRAAIAAMNRVSNVEYPSSRTRRILVNDRLDVALAENADGVHLGENSYPYRGSQASVAKSFPMKSRPAEFLAGVSCHSSRSAQAAAAAGADYLFFGPIFPTPSK